MEQKGSEKQIMYGEKLKKCRKDRKMSLVQVAMLVNSTHATISKYENEKLEPNIEMMRELCKIYGVSADYIIELPKGLNYPEL